MTTLKLTIALYVETYNVFYKNLEDYACTAMNKMLSTCDCADLCVTISKAKLISGYSQIKPPWSKPLLIQQGQLYLRKWYGIVGRVREPIEIKRNTTNTFYTYVISPCVRNGDYISYKITYTNIFSDIR